MNVLWVFAHPESRSLNAALREEGLRALTESGHDYVLSDLYAMRWKASVDGDDFSDHAPDQRLVVGAASKEAHQARSLREDIQAEQAKLRWADTLVVQFPLWWYGMPAILKGWFDRVFVKGFAYGISDTQRPGRTLRYGEGELTGKRALVVVTAGSPAPALGPRGINGQLDHILFPLLHGTLWYTGMSVLPPVAVFGADRVSQGEYETAAALIRRRLTSGEVDEPIPYRYQNGGDYDHDLVLRPDLATGSSGLGVHYAEDSCQ
jgi:NAD(P)H dehydrogenase (quinone)